MRRQRQSRIGGPRWEAGGGHGANRSQTAAAAGLELAGQAQRTAKPQGTTVRIFGQIGAC